MVLIIPSAVWSTMLDAFATEPRWVERVAYLDGVGIAGDGVVVTAVVPDADLYPRWYHVSAEAMSAAASHGRSHGLVRLAQVHTHPGADCRHSDRDDDRAYSQRDGALSIVLPYHAARRPELSRALVHARTAERWEPLDGDEAAAIVRCIPSLVDLRRK